MAPITCKVKFMPLHLDNRFPTTVQVPLLLCLPISQGFPRGQWKNPWPLNPRLSVPLLLGLYCPMPGAQLPESAQMSFLPGWLYLVLGLCHLTPQAPLGGFSSPSCTFSLKQTFSIQIIFLLSSLWSPQGQHRLQSFFNASRLECYLAHSRNPINVSLMKLNEKANYIMIYILSNAQNIENIHILYLLYGMLGLWIISQLILRDNHNF